MACVSDQGLAAAALARHTRERMESIREAQAAIDEARRRAAAVAQSKSGGGE